MSARSANVPGQAHHNFHPPFPIDPRSPQITCNSGEQRRPPGGGKGGSCGSGAAATTAARVHHSSNRRDLLGRLGLNITQYKGSEAAQKLVQSHVLPDRPWHSRLLPRQESVSIPTNAGAGFVSVTTADVGRDT